MRSLKNQVAILLTCLFISQNGNSTPKKRAFLCALTCVGATSLAFQLTAVKELVPWSAEYKKKAQLENDRIATIQAFRKSPERRFEILLEVFNRSQKERFLFKEPSTPKIIEKPLRAGELGETNRIAELWLVEDRYLEEVKGVEAYFERARAEPTLHNVNTAHAARKNFLRQEARVLFYGLFANESSMTVSDAKHEAEFKEAEKFLFEKAPHPLLLK